MDACDNTKNTSPSTVYIFGHQAFSIYALGIIENLSGTIWDQKLTSRGKVLKFSGPAKKRLNFLYNGTFQFLDFLSIQFLWMQLTRVQSSQDNRQ